LLRLHEVRRHILIQLLRKHPARVALGLATAFIAALIGALAVVTADRQASGPETIASSTLAEEAAADARLYVDPHIRGVTCPRGTLRAGSRVLCTAELWTGRAQRKYKLLSVDIVREEGEISAKLSTDRFAARSAGG